jgi:predicted ester cyclase
MSVEENKRLIRRYIEEVVNTGNVENLGQYIAPDYREEGDTTGESGGIEGARRHILGVRTTYPDLHLTVEQQIGEGEWVVTRITARGTHQGEWMGIKPTGKPVEITGVNVDRVVKDRIVEHGGAANMLAPLLEIGAVQVVGSDPAE